ncbi:MAG: heavy metal-responsive transcriptional regulator [Acidimicrobiia bacterium]|nr:heavy metal-responsive transcriptional regulator [Acidimicrobiia bacterium]
MKIGALAEHTSVSTKTVRYYESIGLLAAPRRTPSGYRDYDSDAIERLRFIRDAQATGLTLTEIASVLELKDAGSSSCQHTAALLERHLADLDDQITRLQSARRQLVELSTRAQALDPRACTDPNRCQVIGSGPEA